VVVDAPGNLGYQLGALFDALSNGSQGREPICALTNGAPQSLPTEERGLYVEQGLRLQSGTNLGILEHRPNVVHPTDREARLQGKQQLGLGGLPLPRSNLLAVQGGLQTDRPCTPSREGSVLGKLLQYLVEFQRLQVLGIHVVVSGCPNEIEGLTSAL
jgi:hypothetical protein